MNVAPRLRGAALLTALGIIAAGASLTYQVRAADHADSPNTSEGNLDINDVYAFNQGENLVLAMTVSPLLMPGESTDNAALNPNGVYQFNLDVERDGVAEAVIQVTASGAGPTQTVSFRGPAAPAMAGTTTTIIPVAALSGALNTELIAGSMSAFAGPRDDPFYINLFGDKSATSVLNAAFGAALGMEIGDPAEQSLEFEVGAADDLQGANVIALVVELPKADIAASLGIPADGTFYVWGSTHVR